MSTLCPCCGGPLRDLPPKWSADTRTVLRGDSGVRLSPIQSRIFDIVFRAHPETVTRAALTERVYVDDPNGGPDSTNCVSVHIGKMNKKLAEAGVSIGPRPGVREGIGLAVG